MEENMKGYLNNLIAQFRNATGTKYVDINSTRFIREFSEWIISRQAIGDEYFSFIKSMYIHPIIDEGSAEIGKGVFDSIVLDTGIPMITTYKKGIQRESDKLIAAAFAVYEKSPIIVKRSKNGNQLKTSMVHFKRYLTQNPYGIEYIKDWDDLHNRGDNITVGVYGSIYDKDIEQKLRQMEALKSGLSGYEFKVDYDTNDDMYFCAVSSNREVKPKTKTLTRSW